MAGGPGILEVAMLADLALGGAIRSQVGPALPLPTISMTLQLAPGRTSHVTWADGDCTAHVERTATARVQLRTAAGEAVGDAQGVFALPAMPYDGPARAMPWDSLETDAPTDPVDDVLQWRPESSEAPLVDGVVDHSARIQRCAWGTTHVEQQLAPDGDFLALTPTGPMVNRLGHVQGGVLLTTAVLAAAQQGDFPSDSLVTSTIDFMEAASLDAPVVAKVSILRASGRSLFASVLLVQGERRCCHVTAVFRR